MLTFSRIELAVDVLPENPIDTLITNLQAHGNRAYEDRIEDAVVVMLELFPCGPGCWREPRNAA